MSDQKTNTNWLVRCYDQNNKIVQIKVIKDRTEYEAQKEAESDPDVLNSYDWSMTKVDK